MLFHQPPDVLVQGFPLGAGQQRTQALGDGFGHLVTEALGPLSGGGNVDLALPALALKGHPGILGVDQGTQNGADGGLPQFHRPQSPLGGAAPSHPGEQLAHRGGEAGHEFAGNGGENQHQLLFGADGVPLDQAAVVQDPAGPAGDGGKGLHLGAAVLVAALCGPPGQLPGQ